MEITTLTTEQIKAIAYDLIVEMERIQNNLRLINQELTTRQEAENTETSIKKTK